MEYCLGVVWLGRPLPVGGGGLLSEAKLRLLASKIRLPAFSHLVNPAAVFESHADEGIVLKKNGLQQRRLVDSFAVTVDCPIRFAEHLHGVSARHAHGEMACTASFQVGSHLFQLICFGRWLFHCIVDNLRRNSAGDGTTVIAQVIAVCFIRAPTTLVSFAGDNLGDAATSCRSRFR